MSSRLSWLLPVAVAAVLVAASEGLAAPPGQPDLVSASDSGASTTDNITNDTQPDFSIDATSSNAGLTVTLCVVAAGSTATPTSYGSAVAPVSGLVTVAAGSVISSGTYDVTARVGASASCSSGEASTALTVQLDTNRPLLGSAPTLADFVGSNSSFTFTSTPRFDVAAEAGSVVRLYEGSAQVGSATATSGAVRITVSTPLADGSHTLTAKATDTAGNVSDASPSVSFTVDTAAPSQSSLDLLAEDDDGTSPTDNYTSNPRPRFAVTTEAGARVTLYEDGIALGSATAGSTGTATIRISDLHWLDPGLHCLSSIAMDSLANSSPESEELCLTVAPGTAPFTTNLGVELSEKTLALALSSSVRSRSTVRVVVAGQTVRKLAVRLAAGKRLRLLIRLTGALATARRAVIVVSFRSADERRALVRRAVRL